MKKAILIILAIASLTACKRRCYNCYNVVYENGVKISQEFVRKECYRDNKNTFANPVLQTPGIIGISGYKCEPK